MGSTPIGPSTTSAPVSARSSRDSRSEMLATRFSTCAGVSSRRAATSSALTWSKLEHANPLPQCADASCSNAELVDAGTDQKWNGDRIRSSLTANLRRYASLNRRPRYHCYCAQYARVVGASSLRREAVGAQDRMGEVVGPDAEEINLGGNRADCINSCGCFDHRPQARRTTAGNRFYGMADQLPCREHLIDAVDHGQQQAELRTNSRRQDCAQLRRESGRDSRAVARSRAAQPRSRTAASCRRRSRERARLRLGPEAAPKSAPSCGGDRPRSASRVRSGRRALCAAGQRPRRLHPTRMRAPPNLRHWPVLERGGHLR